MRHLEFSSFTPFPFFVEAARRIHGQSSLFFIGDSGVKAYAASFPPPKGGEGALGWGLGGRVCWGGFGVWG